MEKMINERLEYFVERKELLKNDQSGFRTGRSTTGPALHPENEIRKAQINERTDVERTCDMMWKQGAMIK